MIAPITVTLDANGYIDSYRTFVSARFLFFGTTRVRLEASYDRLESVGPSIWSESEAQKKAKEVKL